MSESCFARIDQYLDRPLSVVIDAGDFDGRHALALKQAHPLARVIVVETSGVNLNIVADCVRNSGVDVYRGFLDKQIGTQLFWESYSDGGDVANGSILRPMQKLLDEKTYLKFKDPVLVRTCTIESMCQEVCVKDIDILRLAVKGAEGLVVQGMGKIRPKLIFMETYETEHYERAIPKRDITEFLVSLGYVVAWEDNWHTLYLYKGERLVPMAESKAKLGSLLLSILIPSIPSRLHLLAPLMARIQGQIGDLPVEMLVALDNKARTIGEKRDMLMRQARGLFVAFCDDDDNILDGYVGELVGAIRANPEVDVVVFNQRVQINTGNPFVVRFGLEFDNEQLKMDEAGKYLDITRKPFHVCAWRKDIATRSQFPALNYSEDQLWLDGVLPHAKTQVRIDKALHEYRYSDAISEAKQ